MKKSTHSKIKNTIILFELLTRQVAADTIKGVEKSPALQIIKEYFKADSVLAKELLLYQTLISERYNTPQKAEYLLDTVTKLRKKINAQQLKEQKYKVINEVKKHYDLKDFFKTNLSEYKLYASIYRVFEGVGFSKVSETVQSRYTIVEHLNRKSAGKLNEGVVDNAYDYIRQDEEVRLLAYKLMIDKFNDKYVSLSDKQKSILKEYINNISNTSGLRNYVVAESKSISNLIKKHIPKVNDQVTAIKLNEVCNLANKLEKIKTVKEDHVLSLLLFHELLKELKHAQ